MRYLLDNGNTILADQAFIDAYHPGAVLIQPTDTEVKQEQRAAIIAKLAMLDANADKPRTRREVALGNAATISWLAAQDDQAAALRAELAALN